MPSNSLNIAVLLVAMLLAPGAAGRQPISGSTHERSACPQKSARAATVIAPSPTPQRKPAPRTVIVKSGGFFAPWPRFMSDLTL